MAFVNYILISCKYNPANRSLTVPQGSSLGETGMLNFVQHGYG